VTVVEHNNNNAEEGTPPERWQKSRFDGDRVDGEGRQKRANLDAKVVANLRTRRGF